MQLTQLISPLDLLTKKRALKLMHRFDRFDQRGRQCSQPVIAMRRAQINAAEQFPCPFPILAIQAALLFLQNALVIFSTPSAIVFPGGEQRFKSET